MKQDYESAKQEYTGTDIGLKAVCRKYHIHSYLFSLWLKRQDIRPKTEKIKEDRMVLYKQAVAEFCTDPNTTVKGLCRKFHLRPNRLGKMIGSTPAPQRAAKRVPSTRQYFFDESFFENLDGEEKTYWFGFICADGHIKKDGYQLSTNLQRRDKQHLEKLAAIFGIPVRDYQIWDKRTEKWYFGSRCIISSKQLVTNLLIKGITHRKSCDLSDAPLAHIPEHLAHHFVRGYFDGDGYIGNGKKNECRATIVGTFAFLGGIIKVVADQTGLPKPTIEKRGKHLWGITWGGNYILRVFRDWLYRDSCVALERKRDRFFAMQIGHQSKTSEFMGVHWCSQKQRYLARVMLKGKTHHLGTFRDEKEAARAYDIFVIKHGLGIHRLNFSQSLTNSEIA